MTDTAIARQNPVTALQSFLKTREKSLAKWVAGRIKPDVLIRLALLEFSRDEKLRRCSAESIYACLITSAQLGLEIGKVKGEAYLIARGGECTFLPGYKGLIKLALRSEGVKSLYSHLVYRMDEFRIQLGSDPRVDHFPSLDENRENPDDLLGCYAVAKLRDGTIDVEWMGIQTLDRIRRAGGGAGPAYKDWADEMARKAPIRRLCKRLPLGDEFFKAAAIDEAHETGQDPPKFDLSDEASDAEVVEEKAGGLAGRVRDAAGRNEGAA